MILGLMQPRLLLLELHICKSNRYLYKTHLNCSDSYGVAQPVTHSRAHTNQIAMVQRHAVLKEQQRIHLKGS